MDQDQQIPTIKPASSAKPFWLRLIQGSSSWLGIFTDEAYSSDQLSANIGCLKFKLINQPSEIKQIMHENMSSYPKHELTQWLLSPLIGRASFSINGEEWSESRNKIESILHQMVDNNVDLFINKAIERLDFKISNLLQKPDGNIIDASLLMTCFTSDVIILMIFSDVFTDEELNSINSDFREFQRRSAYVAIAALLGVPKILLYQHLQKPAQRIRAILSKKIQYRIQHLDERKNQPPDLLDIFLKNENFRSVEILDQVCMLYLAGHETTASTLTMSLYLLASFPTIQNDLLTALSSSSLGGCDRELNKLILSVFSETLRLYPPIPLLIREHTEIQQTSINQCPFKTLVAISPWIMHRHNKYWVEPLNFISDRFLVNPQKTNKDIYIPFGIGPRICPGASLAKKEALELLKYVVCNFKLKTVNAEIPQLVGRLTLRPKKNIKLIFTHHES